jgi:hypothetical protein
MDGLRWIFYKGKGVRGKMEDFAAKRLKTYTAIVRSRFRVAKKKVTTNCTAPFVLMNSRVYVCQDWSVSPVNTYFKLMGNEGRVLRIPEISSMLKLGQTKITTLGSFLYLFTYVRNTGYYSSVLIFELVYKKSDLTCEINYFQEPKTWDKTWSKDDRLKSKETSEQDALADYKKCIDKTRKSWSKKNINYLFDAENLYSEGDWLVDIVPIGTIHLNFSQTSEFVIKMPENTVTPYRANPAYPLSNLEMKEWTFNQISNSKEAGVNLRSYQKFLIGAVSIYDDENSYITLQIEAFEAIKKGMEDDSADIRWEFLKPIVSKKIRVSKLEHTRWGY